ncbi:MAG: hypothetical protein ACFFBD_25210 [Candidatus Hodarchaeota archaeon]
MIELHFVGADHGGVGKTTLSMALLAAMKTLFERDPVIFIDLNENNTTLFETLCYNYREYKFGSFHYECGTGTKPDEYFGIRNREFQRYNMEQFGALLNEIIKPENWSQIEEAWSGTSINQHNVKRRFKNHSQRKVFLIDTNHTLRNFDLLFQAPTNLLSKTGKERVRCYFWHVVTAQKPTSDQVNAFFNLQFPSLRDLSGGRVSNYSQIIFILNFWDILRDEERSILNKFFGDQSKLSNPDLRKWNLNRYNDVSDDNICTTALSHLDVYRVLEEIRSTWPRQDLGMLRSPFIMKNFQHSCARLSGCRGGRIPWNLFIIDFYQRYWDISPISNRPNIAQISTEMQSLGEIAFNYVQKVFYKYRGEIR